MQSPGYGKKSSHQKQQGGQKPTCQLFRENEGASVKFTKLAKALP